VVVGPSSHWEPFSSNVNLGLKYCGGPNGGVVDGGLLEVKSPPTCSGMSTENLQLHQLTTCLGGVIGKIDAERSIQRSLLRLRRPSSRYLWAHQFRCC